MYKMLYILIFSILLFSCSGSDKLARVVIGDKWGYINQEGEIVINPQFDFASFFSEGLARVVIGGKNGYINQEGEIVINPQF